jgi:putative nucleotidyltransferase with HDIG domain
LILTPHIAPPRVFRKNRREAPPGEGLIRTELVQSLVALLKARDPQTAGHCARVTAIATRFALSLGMPVEEVESLGIAGIIHDLGKIAIPDAILLKPERLTPEEWGVIEIHPVVGARLVKALGLGPRVTSAVLHHHEHWDGRGYPHGLSRRGIPLMARILALADGFDALTSHRPYCSARSLPEALEELESCAATQYDPDLTPAFIDLMSGPSQVLFPPPQTLEANLVKAYTL